MPKRILTEAEERAVNVQLEVFGRIATDLAKGMWLALLGVVLFLVGWGAIEWVLDLL